MSVNFSRLPSRSPYSFLEKIRMGIWWGVEPVLFRLVPHKFNYFRCLVLRIFGAKIGCNTFINRKAKIWFPWNLVIGNNSGIGFDALIYNLDKVVIGDFVTISQRVHINTGSHDYLDPAFRLITAPIFVLNGSFVGADTYVGLGVTVGELTVIGARSVVVKDMPSHNLCVGHPCVPIKKIFE